MEELISGIFDAVFGSELISIQYILPVALILGGVLGDADSADGTVRKLSLALAAIGGIGLRGVAGCDRIPTFFCATFCTGKRHQSAPRLLFNRAQV